jgi:hypothetical protein
MSTQTENKKTDVENNDNSIDEHDDDDRLTFLHPVNERLVLNDLGFANKQQALAEGIDDEFLLSYANHIMHLYPNCSKTKTKLKL